MLTPFLRGLRLGTGSRERQLSVKVETCLLAQGLVCNVAHGCNVPRSKLDALRGRRFVGRDYLYCRANSCGASHDRRDMPVSICQGFHHGKALPRLGPGVLPDGIISSIYYLLSATSFWSTLVADGTRINRCNMTYTSNF